MYLAGKLMFGAKCFMTMSVFLKVPESTVQYLCLPSIPNTSFENDMESMPK